MNIEKKGGFTLLEVIIVIIIVGVMASLALPRLFSTIEYSRSTEAFASIASVRSSMERCYLRRNNTYAACNVFANLDLQDPGTSPGSNFTYTWPVVPTASTYTLRATRTAANGGDNASQINVQNNGATITRSGTTVFAGVN